MFEQIAVAVGRVLQLLKEWRDGADVVLIQLCELRNILRVLAVMRGIVELVLDAALRIHAGADVATHLEGGYTGDVRHECQGLQVEHELNVLAERIRYTD